MSPFLCVCPGEVSQLREELICLTGQHQCLSSHNKELSNKVDQQQQQGDM